MKSLSETDSSMIIDAKLLFPCKNLKLNLTSKCPKFGLFSKIILQIAFFVHCPSRGRLVKVMRTILLLAVFHSDKDDVCAYLEARGQLGGHIEIRGQIETRTELKLRQGMGGQRQAMIGQDQGLIGLRQTISGQGQELPGQRLGISGQNQGMSGQRHDMSGLGHQMSQQMSDQEQLLSVQGQGMSGIRNGPHVSGEQGRAIHEAGKGYQFFLRFSSFPRKENTQSLFFGKIL